MPYIFTATGNEVPKRGFTVNNMQFPANWVRMTSTEEHTAVGIEWIEDDRPRKNERYYTITGRRGDWVVTPQNLDKLKARAVADCKKNAGNRLANTDWMVVRKADSGTPIPEDIVAYRAATRAYSNELETTITAADFEGIQKIKQEWPKSAEELKRDADRLAAEEAGA